ncbi:hypothetical protein H0H92_014533 [Tricholoma furcatifolium]|nr:hypothetical protein H0H92_014533 [Tricholoma furcatifolium]
MSQSSRSSITVDNHASTPPTAPAITPSSKVVQPLDIDHIPVTDDPRAWSSLRKVASFPTSTNCPPNALTYAEPLSGHDRLCVYDFGAVWKHSESSNAVITLGAATLADMFEPVERGTKMGIYFMAPLLGPSIGPLIGGGLTVGLGWRAIFWFLSIVSGSICIGFIVFFRDTFRKQRSLIYQRLLRQRLEEAHTQEEVTNTGHSPDPEIGRVHPLDFDLSLRDVNPVKPLILVLRRMNNIPIFISSGLTFGFGFIIAYTTARTLGTTYSYDALTIGFVLIAFGVGSLTGSVLGGRFSDRKLALLKAENGNRKLSVSWTYASTLAYIVDSNTGRSSFAIAVNNAFRGLFAFAAIEVAVPLQAGRTPYGQD